jgi:hypothetical protein
VPLALQCPSQVKSEIRNRPTELTTRSEIRNWVDSAFRIEVVHSYPRRLQFDLSALGSRLYRPFRIPQSAFYIGEIPHSAFRTPHSKDSAFRIPHSTLEKFRIPHSTLEKFRIRHSAIRIRKIPHSPFRIPHLDEPSSLLACQLARLPACQRMPIAPWALSLAQLENLSDRAQNA